MIHQQAGGICICPYCGHKQQQSTRTAKYKSPGRTPLARQAVLKCIDEWPMDRGFSFSDILSACNGEASGRTIHNILAGLRKKGSLIYRNPTWWKVDL